MKVRMFLVYTQSKPHVAVRSITSDNNKRAHNERRYNKLWSLIDLFLTYNKSFIEMSKKLHVIVNITFNLIIIVIVLPIFKFSIL